MSPSIGRSLCLLVVFAAVACATTPSTPTAAEANPAPNPALQPPAVAATEPTATRIVAHSTASEPGAARTEVRRAIFVAAWTLVRDKHFDKKLGGLDWDAQRSKYEPLAVAAPNEPTFYRLLNEMLGELRQSHLEVSGPGADPNPALDEAPPAATTRTPSGEPLPQLSDDTGDPGIVVRVIDGKPTITSLRPGSSADKNGLRPGFVVTHIGGREIKANPPSSRPLRPVEERFYVRLAAARRLSGAVGSRITVRYLDAGDQPIEVMLERDPPRGRALRVGILPPLVPEVRVSQIGDVGIIAFNFFLLDPTLGEVKRAIEGFRARGAKALILDLRGNPGGFGSMAIPVAAHLIDKPLTLGTIHFRDFANTLTAVPSLDVRPFTGRVVIVTDEGTASTSEILAAGLQEARRAIVVGDTSLGAALGSVIEQLPGGAVIQYPVADFRTPKGVSIEGRGVQPDRRVIETRSSLRSGRDAVLDAALAAARASGSR